MNELRQLFNRDKMRLFRRRRLICHYCNSKSELIYDGKISQWECKECEAVNYLDENGEITDPVVSSDSPGPPPTRYAIALSSEPRDFSRDSKIFCTLCLKNQHLYTSSLAQYHADVDSDNNDEDSINDAYNNYRRDLEKRYPQVCEECEPAVLQRLREAGKTAKADHLRRLMDKSRAERFKKTDNSIFTIDTLGKTLWNMGQSGQLIWSFMTVFHSTFPDAFSESESTSYGPVSKFAKKIIVITTSRAWAHNFLLCTVFSIWWCPKYKELNKGFTKQISGLKNWYFLQAAVILLRIFYYLMINTKLFSSEPFSPLTTGAHLVMPVLIILISIWATGSLKVSTTPLWVSDSEKLILRPQNDSLHEQPESMDDVLNHIALSSKTSQKLYYSKSQESSLESDKIPTFKPRTSQNTKKNQLTQNSPKPQDQLNKQSIGIELDRPLNYCYYNTSCSDRFSNQVQPSANINTVIQNPVKLTPSLSDMSEQEAGIYLQTGKLPDRLMYEEMDWQSTENHYHTFNPRPKAGVPQVNHRPISNDPYPFWYKVPAAPTTPAQKLRNPPRQINLQTSQKKLQRNLFQSITQTSLDQSETTIQNRFQAGGTIKHNFELSQPKFLPPETRSESEIMLADLLDDFSLNGTERKKRELRSGSELFQASQGFLLVGATLIFGFALSFLYKSVLS